MSANIDNIISLVKARLQELHPKPQKETTPQPEIYFSVTVNRPDEHHSSTPTPPAYEDSPLPDWVQTLLGRIGIRKDERVLPDLHAANPSFAARIRIAVRDRYYCNAAPLYQAAHIDRRLYSKIISDERRPVSRNTALAFAFALHLNFTQAQELLQSAGHALSPTNDRDVVLKTCLDNQLYGIDEVNKVLHYFKLPIL